MTPSREQLLIRANEALVKGAFDEAGAAFTQALTFGECPQAYEGLSWIEWWNNDGSGAISLRERAFRLYRQAGDDLGAARTAMWLASDHEDFRGEFAIGRGWRQRAHRLLADHPVCPEHGWLAVLEADVALIINDDPTAACRHARAAMAVAAQCGIADMEFVAIAIEGLGMVGRGEIQEGMKRLDEAAAFVLGGEVADEAWASRIMCYLIYGCERICDFGRAAQWCETMREVADRMHFALAQGTCRAHYGSVLIFRGKWPEAEETLSQAMAYLEASRPPWAAEALVRLAELRHRQGRFEEAEALLHRAEWHPQSLLGLARIALDRGRLRDAEDLVERFLRHTPAENRLQRATALELLARVAALSGKPARAAEALADLRLIAQAVPTLPLRGITAFCAAMMAVAAGDLEQARSSFEDAFDLFELGGTPYEAARTRLELAALFAVLGRPERAREEGQLALTTFETLGAAFSAGRARALVDKIGTRADPAGDGEAGGALTARQVEILRLVGQGRSDREIASRLGISEHTVHRHVANILMRLDMPTRAAAAAHAAGRGLI
ncbi:LuxR family transcriptional regulator [Devosia nitrariae]|uniref:HTH luxR-type domain-containing protein n=1 Tax=Devosia nitrariae TaxID=2071872 RepID=A0ABQ5W1H1_9HYPH|nr:LuxR family transcriptional regulator [Devosia nitrariae]GLQ53719.1 hypothetical protein GCM10010862_09780 [Devosia nitrariae]